MTPAFRFIQPLADCRDPSLVGGKAANLGELIRAGFSVPDGFAITTHAFHAARASSTLNGDAVVLPNEVADEICAAYQAMHCGAVAVRSSATAEDAAALSMAGQYQTILNVEGESALLDAVQQCWQSLHAERAQAYLDEQRIDASGVAMAVVVQRLVDADIAGVIFTANPHNGRRREMLLEASRGLGEAVVSGRVQPDSLRLAADTGQVLFAAVAGKQPSCANGDVVPYGKNGDSAVGPCLGSRDVHRLWQLGRQIAEHFGSPQDIEWAARDGEFFVLQSRPITTLHATETAEEIPEELKEHLRRESAAGRGPWVAHNLGETLNHPTPLTWSVVRRFMSGAGGMGAMYRLAGFEPSPAACDDGFLELLGGRIYMDVSRAGEMFFEDFPFAYDLDVLRESPDASQTPPTVPRGSLAARLKAGRRLAAVNANLHAISEDFDRRLRDEIFPAIERYVGNARSIDLAAFSNDGLIACWRDRERQVLDDFGARLLLPSLISTMAIAELRAFLAENFWDEDSDALAYMLSSGGPPNRTIVADAELHDVALGTRSLDTWLADHGHRAENEFDLAAPRWRERPEVVRERADHFRADEGPLERHRRHAEAVDRRIAELHQRLSRYGRGEFDARLAFVRRYINFREDAKDLLMLGYELLCDVALKAGRRLDVADGVFYLTREELFDALRVGFAPLALIERRTKANHAESHVTLPRVLDEYCGAGVPPADDAAGETPAPQEIHGFAISAGEASGPARVRTSPNETIDAGDGYILVCPATDPSWTPLFVRAAGLVLERGGMLSHGAIIARELGLPAVVLPEATRLFRDGEVIRVDGNRGRIARCAAENRASLPCPASPAEADNPDDARLPPNWIPPPPGRKDRMAARIRNGFATVWIVYLLAAFLLPERWIYQPTLAILDFLFWPLVRAAGKPATVAILAAAMAAIVLAVQKLVADNRRLREAKRRAAILLEKAKTLPRDSPRRRAMSRVAAPVNVRALAAAMVPIGILLGPMVMPFCWLRERVDPSVANAPAGSPFSVVAMVDGQWAEPIRLETPPGVALDDATPAVRTLPPLRKTLERLLSQLRQPSADSAANWEVKIAEESSRQQAVDSLQAYLAAGIPPQKLAWTLHPPENVGGRFQLTVSTAGHPPVSVIAVLGDDCPPALIKKMNSAAAPLREVRLVYPQSKSEPVFWRPFTALADKSSFPCAGWLSTVKVGWLLLYIVVYVPVLFLLRWLMKVA
jgi:rifampicin phosphotransferase